MCIQVHHNVHTGASQCVYRCITMCIQVLHNELTSMKAGIYPIGTGGVFPIIPILLRHNSLSQYKFSSFYSPAIC